MSTESSSEATGDPAPPRRGEAPARLSKGGTARRLRAISRKEFIQLWRDRRTLLLMVGMPLVLLVIFGDGIRLSVRRITAELVGRDSAAVRTALESQGQFDVRSVVAPTEAAARDDLLHGRTAVAVVIGPTGLPTAVLVDGSNAFIAQNSLEYLRSLGASPSAHTLNVIVLYNPTLRSANFMIPAEIGMIMLWVGTVATAIGVVLFHVTIRGNPLELLVFAVPYLVASLSIGLLVSTVAQNQRQAMQTAAFLLLPQILLSGTLFPLAAIPWGIRWVSQLFPLTYFTPITRGVFLKGLGIGDLWPQVAVLSGMAVLFTVLAAVTFRSRLD